MGRIVDENGYPLDLDCEDCDVSNMDTNEAIVTDLDTAIIVSIPANTTKIEFTVTMLDENDNFIKGTRTMFLPEIVEARIEGNEWVNDNVRYVINEDYNGGNK